LWGSARHDTKVGYIMYTQNDREIDSLPHEIRLKISEKGLRHKTDEHKILKLKSSQ